MVVAVGTEVVAMLVARVVTVFAMMVSGFSLW